MRDSNAPEWRDEPGRGWRSVSELKLRITVEDITFHDGTQKRWERVRVLTQDSTFLPSFEDLYRIIRPICDLENAKYPEGEGRRMVARFLAACCRDGVRYPELEAEFDIPHRESSDEHRWRNEQVHRELEDPVHETWRDRSAPEDPAPESSDPDELTADKVRW